MRVRDMSVPRSSLADLTPRTVGSFRDWPLSGCAESVGEEDERKMDSRTEALRIFNNTDLKPSRFEL